MNFFGCKFLTFQTFSGSKIKSSFCLLSQVGKARENEPESTAIFITLIYT